MRRSRQILCGLFTVSVLVAVPSTSTSAAPVESDVTGTKATATIRYTEHGIPHIIADGFTGLGYGYGYAVAKDNICVLANSYTTVRAQRSRFFGPGGSGDVTVSSATTNLASDLYFQQVNNSGVVWSLVSQAAPRGPQREVRDMVAGYVEGYNRYLRDVGGAAGIGDPTCRGGEWVTPITETDVWHMLHAMATYAGTGSMVDGIVNARPGTATGGLAANAETAARFRAGLDERFGENSPGSNGIAVGAAGAAHDNSILLGNPHFIWQGVNRFWQAHLTVPGKLNAAGAGLLGTPFLSIGFNDKIAWTHTWAAPVTFGLYELRLAPDDPTSYLVDGKKERMRRTSVSVPVKQPDGRLAVVTRTLYATRYGPVTSNAASMDLPWTGTSAYAVRDANATNMRLMNTSFGLATAQDTAGVVDALSRTQGLPIFNTLAVDRSGNALYADIQVVPHVTDALAQRCATPLGQYLFHVAGLALLNGADSTCAWGADSDSVEPGLLGPSRMQRLVRRDYVTNSNQSPWLSNPHAPITGYQRILGDVYTERTPRTRESLLSVEEGLAEGGFTAASMRQMLFTNRSRVAELAAADTARMCAEFPGGLAPSTGGPVDVTGACAALASWDHTYSLDSRGSLLFERFVMKLVPSAPVPASLPWRVPFDPQAPLTTPNTLDTGRADVQRAFGDAVAELRAAGIPLDARLGDHQTVTRGNQRIPLPGGSWQMGILNVVHPVWHPQAGNVEVATGSTYIQVVAFDGSGCPNVTTLLASSQSADPTSPYHADQTAMFSNGQWVQSRFCEESDLAAPASRVVRLTK
ncbi:acyl-homoserine-lactone acylase [Micromonospora eburnea]|uniref:Acyl-homoserine-lactone acylase n=1 Tax=Micromonospora eburnea TaxID=227316 RepID=A0A1C6U1U2_9ACTN|nr:acyl-homoserine-lactone acylase [Micromonospora eburnea]